MEREAVYYKTKELNQIAKIPQEFAVKVWRPTVFNLVPPQKPFKYIVLSFAYLLRLLSNRNYFLIQVFDNEQNVSSLLVVPKIFKFDYMKKKDIQFIYVMTNANYRGMNIAAATVLEAVKHLTEKVDGYWYVTNTTNKASIRVAEKLGFKRITN